MKSYTDLEQSKRLAEILPLESADMTYCAVTEGMREKMIIKNWEVNVGLDIAIKKNLFSYRNGYMIPCWSLAALFKMLPYSARLERGSSTELCSVTLPNELESSDWYIEPVDAAFEMLLKLHELKML